MDVADLINSFNKNIGWLVNRTWGGQFYRNISEYEPMYIMIIISFLVILITTALVAMKWHQRAVAAKLTKESSRFRKRDKALFYGRKMLRKVRSISGEVRSSGQGRKRKMVMRFARKILQLKKDTDAEQLKVLEPSAEYLQEEMLSDDRMPPDALYMLQSIRVFGHFEKPIFLRLCKHTETVKIHAGGMLFKIGDADENVYVVQSGKLNVFITQPDASMLSLKVVKTGESVTSLLSFIDVLSNKPNTYKTVSAKAIVDTTVLRLPMNAFREIFDEYPDIFIRVMQVIMVRLQRVTFTALHQYLGLTSELMNPGSKSKRFPSPAKSRTKQESVDSFYWTTPSTYFGVSGSQHRRVKSSVDMKASQFSASNFENFSESNLEDKKNSESMDEESYIEIATEGFVREMDLDDDTILKGKVQCRELASGTHLMQEESNKDIALIYLISGSLHVSQKMMDTGDMVHMFTAHAGEVVGGLAVLTGEPSFFTIRSKHFTVIGLISKSNFYSMMKIRPSIVLHIARTVVLRLSAFVRQVDFALDWVFLESGRAVYRQNDDSDCTYILLSGRLRSVITNKNDKKEIVAEYGKGDLVGIVEMVTHTKRSTTVLAVRDSELAKLPEGLFNAIKLRFPIVVTRLINLLGHRILGTYTNTVLNVQRNVDNATIDSRPSQSNFSTVAIVPISDDVPLTAFTYELYHSLKGIGPTLRLTSDVIRKTLGTSIMDPNNEYRLASWLAQQEDQHKMSLYQCDLNFSLWTQRCIRQADCILIVGLRENSPNLGKLEKEVERLARRTQKELVLLHKEGGGKPQNTLAWINMRSFISSHHHIVCPKRMFSRKSLFRINDLYAKVCKSEPNIHSDFSRLARWLTGTSVGLVLGGGGARGAAHIGMIKAIQEAGIPIDMVGGVSIGAFMGALWCQEKNIVSVTQKARSWAGKMTQWWRQILDLTYPMTSMFSGRDFNHTIKSTFGETYIEDLWLPYFTVTTDITASCKRVHTHGSLWRYVRSSMSLSGYMPPLCDPVDGHLLLDGGYTNNLPGQLWRYVRGSMSIVGLFPPICDPVDGHLLADGCYVNNVPADVMRSMGAHYILAIDVGSVDDQDLTNYGDDLSGWWLLWKRWNPFTTAVKVPNLPDIQSRLAYVSCVRQLEEVKNSDYCEYIRPPIDKYRTLQFGSFDEIREVGYIHGKTYFEGKLKSGTLPVDSMNARKHKFDASHIFHPTGYTFTDLAQMVCTVSRPQDEDTSNSESSDDEYEDGHGYASEPSAGILEQNEHFNLRRPGGSLSENEAEYEDEYSMDLEKGESM